MRDIVIVDDHGPFRMAVREMLEGAGFRVVGEAGEATAALDLVRTLLPDVVLLDVNLPGEDGFSVCERLQCMPRIPAVVMTSTHDAAAFRRRLRASAARGFIPKVDLTGSALVALLEARPR